MPPGRNRPVVHRGATTALRKMAELFSGPLPRSGDALAPPSMIYSGWRVTMPDVLADLCGDYLARLQTALSSVDPSDREQIVAQVAEHLDDAIAGLPTPSEEGLRQILERLGSPEEIAAAAVPEQSHHRSKQSATWLAVASGALAMALALGIAAIAGAFDLSSPTSVVKRPTAAFVVVPNVVGMATAQAAGNLQEAGLYNSIDELGCGNGTSRGYTVAESPPPGSRVASGTRISIQVACSGQ